MMPCSEWKVTRPVAQGVGEKPPVPAGLYCAAFISNPFSIMSEGSTG